MVCVASLRIPTTRRRASCPRVLVPRIVDLRKHPRKPTHHLIVRAYFPSYHLPSALPPCPAFPASPPRPCTSCPCPRIQSPLRSFSCRQTQTTLLSSPHVPSGYPTFLFISPLQTANIIPVASPPRPLIQSTDCSPLTLPWTTIPSFTWTLSQSLRKRLPVHPQGKCTSILPSYSFPTRLRPFVPLFNLSSYQI
jgi:hypothetical protein